MKSKSKKLCGVALAAAACALASVSLAACGTSGDGDGKCTVTFDAGRGTLFNERMYTVEVDKGSLVSEPSEEPVCDGYIFCGWNLTGNDGDALWNFDSDVVTGNTALQAVWNRSYTVTYDAGAGTFEGGGNTYETAAAENSKLTPPAVNPPDGNRELVGWLYYGTVWNFETDTVTRDITLIARWEIKSELAAALEPFIYGETDDGIVIKGVKDKTITSAVVPNAVVAIDDNAFKDCAALVSVDLGDGVESVGYSAFADCTSLKTVVFPSGEFEMDGRVFVNCTSLESIELPETLTALGGAAFNGCTSLETVTLPASVTEISNYMFADCAALKSVEINGNVTKIGLNAFEGCTSLEEFEIPAGVTVLSAYAFYGCTSLRTVALSDGLIGMGDRAFYGCTSLAAIDIPNKVEVIGFSAFANCTSLAEVTIGAGVTAIKSAAFEGCTALLEIDIPDGVTELGYGAFEGCSSLKKADIGGGVKVLDGFLFKDCYSLHALGFGDITEIRDSTFLNCVSLLSFTVPASVTNINRDAFTGCARMVEIYNLSSVSLGGVNLPMYITKHADASEKSVIDGTSAFVFVTRSEGSETVTYLLDYVGDMEDVALPADYKGESYAVFDYALACKKGLNSVTFSAGVTDIGSNILMGSSNVSTLSVESGNAVYSSSGNCIIEKAGKRFVLGCKGSVIPTDGSVTVIGGDVFCRNSDIELDGFVIPSAVTTVERGAFEYCNGIIRKDANGLCYVDKWVVALDYDGKDLVAVAPAADTVGIADSAFSSNIAHLASRRIGSFTANPALKYIGDNAFYGCENMTAVSLCDGLVAIGGSAFGRCEKLVEIVIPDSVSALGSAAFMNCEALEYAKLPNGLTEIDYQTFDGCAKLSAVVIPSSVKSIGHNVFRNCAQNLTVYYGGDASEWGGIRIANSGNTLITSETARIVYYSETAATGAWHFGANGKPELWQ